MTKDRRFRGFSLAQVERVQMMGDGSISVLGVSETGDAVALIVRPCALDELLSGLEFPQPAPPPPTGAIAREHHADA